MGYSTTFDGVLTFASEPTTSQLGALNSMLGEDVRDHKEWQQIARDVIYIDLELLKDFSGIKWNNAEKTYGMVEGINLITSVMRQTWPEFRLQGTMLAQGEDITDRWRVVLDDNGHATKQAIQVNGKRVKCPHCDEPFIVEE